MILFGGVNLYFDSVINISINSQLYHNYKQKWAYICISSIVTTLVFHYIAYFSLIFRAVRIFKMMELETAFLDKIYKLALSDNDSDD